MTAPSEHDAAARHLVELYAERVRLTRDMAQQDRPTSVDAQAVLDAGVALDRACEQFRRAYYPRRAEVIVGLYAVMVCSATRRRVETVLDLFGDAAFVDPLSTVVRGVTA